MPILESSEHFLTMNKIGKITNYKHVIFIGVKIYIYVTANISNSVDRGVYL